MLVIAGFAMVDLLTLKEGVTVVIPDHKPLLAVVAIFGERMKQKRESADEKFPNTPDGQGCGVLSSPVVACAVFHLSAMSADGAEVSVVHAVGDVFGLLPPRMHFPMFSSVFFFLQRRRRRVWGTKRELALRNPVSVTTWCTYIR